MHSRAIQVVTLVWVVTLSLELGEACAHPLGNLGISHYAAIRIEREYIELRYVLDFAEIPAFQEIQREKFTPENRHVSALAYAARMAGVWKDGLVLTLDGQRLSLSLIGPAEVTFPSSTLGVPTMRAAANYRALHPSLSVKAHSDLRYRDENYRQRSGWKEVILNAGAGVLVFSQSVPGKDRSAELTQYPSGLLNSPPQTLEAHAVFKTDRRETTAR